MALVCRVYESGEFLELNAVTKLLFDKSFDLLLTHCIIFPDLQLHGDDVYYTLEDESRDGNQNRETSVPSNSIQSKVWLSGLVCL